MQLQPVPTLVHLSRAHRKSYGERRKVGARVVGLDDRRLKKARLANKRLVLGELRKLLEAQRASLGHRWRDLQSIAGNRGLDRVWGTISGTSSGASRGLC